jgi:hypothetical protein
VIKFTGAVEKTPFYFGRICQAISYRRVLFRQLFFLNASLITENNFQGKEQRE